MLLTSDKKYSGTKYKVYGVEETLYEDMGIDKLSPFDLVFPDGLRIRGSTYYGRKNDCDEIPKHFFLDEVDVNFVESIENKYDIPKAVASLEDFIKYRRKNRKKKIYVRYFNVCSDEAKFFFVDEVLEIIPLVLNQQVSPLSKYDNRIQKYQEQFVNCSLMNEKQFQNILLDFDVNCEFLTLLPDIFYTMTLESVSTEISLFSAICDRSFKRFVERRHAVLYLVLQYICGSNLKEKGIYKSFHLDDFRYYSKEILNEIMSSDDILLSNTEFESAIEQFGAITTFAKFGFQRIDDFMTDGFADEKVHRDKYIDACNYHMVPIKLDTRDQSNFPTWKIRYYFIIGSIEAVYDGADYGKLIEYILPALAMKSPKEEWDPWFETMKNQNQNDSTPTIQNGAEKQEESESIETARDQQKNIGMCSQNKDEKPKKPTYSNVNFFPSPAESEEEGEQKELMDSDRSNLSPTVQDDSEERTSIVDSNQSIPPVHCDAKNQADAQVQNGEEERTDPVISANALEQKNGQNVETPENPSVPPEASSTNRKQRKKQNQSKVETIVYVQTCRSCTKNNNRKNHLELEMIKTRNQMKEYELKMRNANQGRTEEANLRLKAEQRATMFEQKALKTMEVENRLREMMEENKRLQRQINSLIDQSDTIKKLEEKNLKLKEETKKLENANRNLRNEKKQLSEEISNLNRNLEKTELELVNKTIEVQESNDRCEALTSENTKNQETITALFKDVDRTKGKIAETMNLNARLCQNHAQLKNEVSKLQKNTRVSKKSWNKLEVLATLPEEFSVSECFCQLLDGTFKKDSECESCHKHFHYQCIRKWHKEAFVLPDGTTRKPDCPLCKETIALRK